MSRQYNKPPLKEAVCEFRFESGTAWDLAVPGLIYSELSDEFPKRLPTAGASFGATFIIGPEGIRQEVSQQAEFHHQIDQQQGLRFWRDDDAGVIRISPNLLSVSHYPPYPSWDGYLPIIRKALDAYKLVAEPQGLQRIGLRYINEFKFSADLLDLEDYFDFYPFTGSRMPNDYMSFIIGLQLEFSSGRDLLKIQMMTGARDDDNQLPIQFDLDYFLATPGQIKFENVFGWLDEAHTHIEDTFEGALTDKLRERFEETCE